jgi:uncharacterized protein YndB with AHSA1/START domain
MNTSTDRIERKIVLKATRARVWRALTNIEEFNSWYEHIVMELTIEKCEPERLLSWRWHPNAIDPKMDYSSEPTSLVEFQLQDVVGGTLLTLVESGIDKIPVARRLDVFRNNSGGWDAQMKNIEKHVTTS